MRANITLFIDPRQEFDRTFNGFMLVLDYELPFVWLIVSSGSCHHSPVMASYLLSPDPRPLIGQLSPDRLLIGRFGRPLCPVICVQRESVRANVCPHSIISRQMTGTRPSYVSTSPQRGRAKRFAEIYNVQFKQFTLAMAWCYLPAGGQLSANKKPGMVPGDQWEIRSDCMGVSPGAALHSQDIQNWWSIKI